MGSFEMITGEQVKRAMISKGIERVDHHACAVCDHIVYYQRVGDELFFHGSCECSSAYRPSHPRTWQNAADWINIQITEESKQHLMRKFGLGLNGYRKHSLQREKL